MTVWAYRDGIMAADSCVAAGDIVNMRCTKIARGPDHELIVGAGVWTDLASFQRWWKDKSQSFPTLKDNDFMAIVVMPDGTVRQYDCRGNWSEIIGEFYAGGNGREVAIGAMAHGATAIEAVAIACRHVICCDPPIQVESLVPDGA